MALQQVLLLAVTRMLSGVCLAGFTTQPHPRSVLTWLRPVKEHDTLQLGDITDAQGRVLRCYDVVEFPLVRARPQPPHCEDWIGEFVRLRPRVLRALAGDRRDVFLAEHLDRAPGDVLCDHTRSLCLVRPDDVWTRFALNPDTGKYDCRVGFTLSGIDLPDAASRGVAATDLRWRAFGRQMLGGPGELRLDRPALLGAAGAREVYLALGLSRSFDGRVWPLVIGVHTVPDYDVTIDYTTL